MRPIILLVHGTFANNAKWTQPESLLCRELAASLHDPDICAVQWSGRNTFKARTEAGDAIAEAIQAKAPNVPVAIVCHSHGGSAVAYGIKRRPEAFRNVRTVVCLATPFFGFSIRPGYQALLLATLVSLFFFMYQLIYLALAAATTEYFPDFTEQPYGMVVVGLGLLVGAAAIASSLWSKKAKLFRSFENAVTLANGWDTTQVSLPNPLFVRSMGDEVGLSLGTLQFAATLLNKMLNGLSRILSHVLATVRSAAARPLGFLATVGVAALLIAAIGLPAAVAATFGYHPQYWVDILYPWSDGFNIIDPEFGLVDQFARAIYAVVLLMMVIAYTLMFAITFLTLVAVSLSWITTAAFGCLSLRLAIAAEWAVEPTPEGLHTFLNGGWNRDPHYLRNDRPTLQHSEPYNSDHVLKSVVNHIATSIDPGLSRTDPGNA